jgi:2-oxoisovalerate dehydrogenase E2 component (dihydrolipoyl transacylase)
MDFLLPDLGEGLTEAELLSWRVAEGDVVELNQIIAEVETAKAAVELPSPVAGRVAKLHGAEGDVIDVGAPLITFAVDAPNAAQAAEPAEERIPVLVGYGATAGTASRRRRIGVPAQPTPPPPPVENAEPIQPSEPIIAPRPATRPQVRKLAKDLGIDLTTVTGTGAGGVITRNDVLAAQAPVVPAQSPVVPAAGDERIPVRGVRKATAEAMVRSAFTAPHVTEFITVDVTPTMELLERLRGSAFTAGVKLTPLTFVATALLAALPDNPTLNSSWAGDEIVLHHDVNLGIAAATPRGLLVPNIKNAGALDLLSLGRALNDLTEAAKAGRSSPSDLTGGTITITNVGVFGVDTGTPILNPGEAAILCLGSIRKQPWVVDDELAVRWVTTLSLSFDHRLVDGEQGSRFLSRIAATLATG